MPTPEEEKGSYDDVVKNIPLWLSQFPHAGTKVTISSADLPYIKDSVLHLYSLGIHEVNINCVFEDVWNEGDDEVFEQQLISLADAIIDGKYYRTMPALSSVSIWESPWTVNCKTVTGVALAKCWLLMPWATFIPVHASPSILCATRRLG